MKKIMSLMLATIMTVGLLASCGSGTPNETTKAPTDPPKQTEDTTEPEQTPEATDEPEETTPGIDLGGRTVKMAAWWDLTPVEGQDEQTDQLIERYAQMEADYNFSFEYVNIPWEDYQRTYITNSMGGDAIADLAIAEYTWIYPNLSMNGFLADVSELQSFDFTKEKWNQDFINLATLDGAIYGFEAGRTFPVGVLFWNKSMFEREGLPSIYDDLFAGDWTWEKMLDYAEQLTKDTDGDGVIDQWGVSGTNLPSAFVFSNGGSTIDMSDPKAPKFNLMSDEALQGYQALQDFAQVNKVVELNPEGAEWDYARSQFINGNVGMFSGPWWMVDSIKEGSEDEYGVALFPMGPNADNYVSHNTATNIWTIPETVEDKETAAMLFDLRTEPLPDETPDDWRIYFEDRVNDAESVEVIRMLQEDGLTVIDTTSHFAGVVELSYGYHYAIEHGQETPQAAISAIADQAQNLIDTAMRKSADDIISDLTPDE